MIKSWSISYISNAVVFFIIVILFLPSLNYTVPNLEGFTDIELSPRLTTENIKNLKMGQQKMTSILREFDRICSNPDLQTSRKQIVHMTGYLQSISDS